MEQRSYRRLCGLFTAVYMISYMTRINFGAVLVEMVAAGLDKTVLALAPTGSFITYGAGQLVSGWLGDRIQPKRLLVLGLSVTAAMNFLVPFCSSPWLMVVCWSINGFAQAFMWPPLVKLMAGLFDSRQYIRATVWVSYGSSVGTIAVFLLTPVLVSFWDWRSVFWGGALLPMLLLPLIVKLCPAVPLVRSAAVAARPQEGLRWSWVLTGILVIIMLKGALRDGVTTWMPSYISENYSLGNNVAILTSVLLPIFSMACYKLTEWIYATRWRNPMLCAGAIFSVGATAAAALLVFTGNSTVGSVVSMALLAGCTHGVSLILTCMVPAYFKKTGRVSLISGAINSCTYIGSAASTYGVALLTDGFGWTATVAVWLAIAVAGTTLCFVCVRPFRKKYM